ncbi:alpha-L-glutamate ligase, partial [Halalkalibacterium halodurans]|nr:alpha-L-glutamate ligase [Halalkalibacterium halodurans]
MKKIYVIHENDEWTVHLFKRLEELGLPYEDWHLRSGSIKLHEAPPEGVFYNRMSASSHTRGHRYAPELAGAVLAWLERHGRTVINGSRALQLEVSKVNQYMALETFGITTPKTIVAVG